jgi:hypothetical protein
LTTTANHHHRLYRRSGTDLNCDKSGILIREPPRPPLQQQRHDDHEQQQQQQQQQQRHLDHFHFLYQVHFVSPVSFFFFCFFCCCY